MNGASIARLVIVELRKSVDTRAGRWVLGLMAALGACSLALTTAFGGDEASGFDSYVGAAVAPMVLLLPIIGVLSMTSDWSQRSVLTTFALVPRRQRVLTAKLLSSFTLVVAAIAVVTVMSLLIYLLHGAATGRSYDWAQTPAALIGLAGTAVGATLTGVTFGALLLHTPLAVAVVVLVPTLYDVVLTTTAPDVAPWISSYGVAGWLSQPTLGEDLLPTATSFLLWTALPLGLGWWRQLHREVR